MITSRGEETLKVYIRVRPPILKEVQYEGSVIVQGANAISIISDNKEATCTFDHVFNEIAQQEEVFEFVKPLLVDVLSGVNSCIFAYGQTSSGKSYTMIGPNGGSDMMRCDKDLWGILPRASEFLMGYLHDKAAEGMLTYEVKASFLQIYNENLYDLLRDSGPAIEDRMLAFEKDKEELKIREVPKARSRLASTKEPPKEIYVSGLSEFRVETSEDILKIVAIGTNNRMTRSTDFNLTSSRSHALLTLTFEIESESESGQTLISRSKLNLIDLAGSEKLPYLSTASENNPKHVKELSAINKSLSSLGNVISALASSTRSHIPYRDSKLTRILQDSLSGNTRTILVACVAPTVIHTMETMSTLQFAERAKNVKLQVRANTLVDDKVTLAKAQSEITRLKALLSHAMKQLEEKNGGMENGASASEFERIVVENEKLKRENITLKRLAKSNSLGSFDDMSVRSSLPDPRRSARKESNAQLRQGFMSGADRFAQGQQQNEFFGGNKMSSAKKYRSPVKSRKSNVSAGGWDSDTEVDRDRGRKNESPSAFLRKQQQQSSKQSKQQSKFHNKLFKAINDRQAAELGLLLEEANRKMEQQQAQYMSMQDPQQQFLMMMQQQQLKQQQQLHQGSHNQSHASHPMPGFFPQQQVFDQYGAHANHAGNPNHIPAMQQFPAAGYHAPPGYNAMYPYGQAASPGNMVMQDNGMDYQNEFAPMDEDEGKHIPIISISAQDQKAHPQEAPPQRGRGSNKESKETPSSGRAPPPQPVVKMQPPAEPVEPPTNRIFLKKNNANSNNGPQSMPGVNPTNHGFVPSSSHNGNSSALPKLSAVHEDASTRGNHVSNSTSLFASAVNMYSNASKASHMLTGLVRNVASSNSVKTSSDDPTPANLRGDGDDVGKTIEMYSYRLNAWERLQILDFEPGKRLYKCQYPNGSCQWLDLMKKPVRAMQ